MTKTEKIGKVLEMLKTQVNNIENDVRGAYEWLEFAEQRLSAIKNYLEEVEKTLEKIKGEKEDDNS